jgi:hypothetical protein
MRDTAYSASLGFVDGEPTAPIARSAVGSHSGRQTRPGTRGGQRAGRLDVPRAASPALIRAAAVAEFRLPTEEVERSAR